MANYVSTHTGEQIDNGVDIALNNVLTKDNTTSFTPSGNYNPATKKYVDDSIGNIDLSSLVSKTGDETVAGVKTFSSFPLTPSEAPTTDYQVANKKFVEDYSITNNAETEMVITNIKIVETIPETQVEGTLYLKLKMTDVDMTYTKNTSYSVTISVYRNGNLVTAWAATTATPVTLSYRTGDVITLVVNGTLGTYDSVGLYCVSNGGSNTYIDSVYPADLGVPINITSLISEGTFLLKADDEAKACVRGDTLVLTPEGFKEISSIKEGDIVSSLHGDTMVTKTTHHPVSTIYNISVKESTIRATWSHLFKTKGQGLKQVRDLVEGDILYSPNGEAMIETIVIDHLAEPLEVYEISTTSDMYIITTDKIISNCERI